MSSQQKKEKQIANEVVEQLIGPDIRICILQRGFIYIGKFQRIDMDCKLIDAAIIRRWGTSKGLGELFNGPKVETILDKCHGIVEFHWLTCVSTIQVNSESWKGHL